MTFPRGLQYMPMFLLWTAWHKWVTTALYSQKVVRSTCKKKKKKKKKKNMESWLRSSKNSTPVPCNVDHLVYLFSLCIYGIVGERGGGKAWGHAGTHHIDLLT